MKNFMQISPEERKANLLRNAEQSFCSLLFYYDDQGNIQVCACAEQGNESDILNLYSKASLDTYLFLDQTLNEPDWEGGKQ